MAKVGGAQDGILVDNIADHVFRRPRRAPPQRDCYSVDVASDGETRGMLSAGVTRRSLSSLVAHKKLVCDDERAWDC